MIDITFQFLKTGNQDVFFVLFFYWYVPKRHTTSITADFNYSETFYLSNTFIWTVIVATYLDCLFSDQ